MTMTMASNESAELLNVPQDKIVCVEHPCLVSNVDKAIKSLGGEQQMKNVGIMSHQPLHRHMCLS